MLSPVGVDATKSYHYSYHSWYELAFLQLYQYVGINFALLSPERKQVAK